MRLYLSANAKRNAQVTEVLDSYGVSYDTVRLDQLTQADVLELMRCSVDCFEFLTPICLTYKRRKYMPLSRLISLILEKRTRTLRLPLIVEKGQVYPDVSVEDLRTFLPRKVKKSTQEALRHLLTV